MKINVLNESAVCFILIIFVFLCTQNTTAQKKESADKMETNKNQILAELEHTLDNLFNLWYPLSIDSADGGYFSDINYKWELEGRQNKMIVTQARHVWSASNAAIFFKKYDYLPNVAKHGFEFLKDVMWDQEYGGFYNLVDRKGNVIKEDGSIIKNAYGNAFAIYGLAAYYKVSGDTAALRLAETAFNWLDKYSYDPEYGGYFQFLARNGEPFKAGYGNIPPKDQNSSIHILECFTELYNVWPDNKLKERLFSLLHIIRDKYVTGKGYLNLFFNRDLTPVTFNYSRPEELGNSYELDHVSFGHDIETGYLLLEAAKALRMKNDSTTLRIAKKMVDHTLNNGWDSNAGGIFDGGYYFKGNNHISIVKNTKEWWSQIEALNSCLLMSELFPNDKMNYYEKFCGQWEYIKRYLIDNTFGGFYWGGIDEVPDIKFTPKGTIWKGNYHTSRGLINCIRRLEREG